MAYVTQNFYSGQKLTDEHLKHMEAGIATADANATKALDIAQKDHATLPPEIAGKADNWMIEEETGLAYLTSGGKKISSGIMIPNDGSGVGGSGSAGTPYAVQYVFQKLTDEQKEQARKNIGAGMSVLAFNTMVDLTALGVKAGSIDYAAANSAILQEQIETYPTGGKTFYLPAGTYHFNPIDLTGISGTITVRLKGQGYGLDTDWFSGIQTTIITNKQDFLYDRRNPSKGVTFYVDDMKFYSYQGYSEIPTGVCFGAETNGGSEHNFHFHNVQIHGFDYGFRSPGYSCGGSGGKNISFSTCHYGIWIDNTTHLFYIENLELTYNRVGVRLHNGGSPCSIKNVHVASGYLGADRENFSEYIVFHTKGNTEIEKVYHEAYESNALAERTILFDYEGWAYGCGPLIIKDTLIAKPSGKGGKFLRARSYLGAGPETGAETYTAISPWNKGHYPEGLVHLIDCRNAHKSDIASLFDVGFPGVGISINGSVYYCDGMILAKDPVFRLKSAGANSGVFSTKTYDDVAYYEIPWPAFPDIYCGVAWGSVEGAFPINTFDPAITNGFCRVKGTVRIDGTIPDDVECTFGMMSHLFAGDASIHSFFPIVPLKSGQTFGNVIPVDFIVDSAVNGTTRPMNFVFRYDRTDKTGMIPRTSLPMFSVDLTFTWKQWTGLTPDFM